MLSEPKPQPPSLKPCPKVCSIPIGRYGMLLFGVALGLALKHITLCGFLKFVCLFLSRDAAPRSSEDLGIRRLFLHQAQTLLLMVMMMRRRRRRTMTVMSITSVILRIGF